MGLLSKCPRELFLLQVDAGAVDSTETEASGEKLPERQAKLVGSVQRLMKHDKSWFVSTTLLCSFLRHLDSMSMTCVPGCRRCEDTAFHRGQAASGADTAMGGGAICPAVALWRPDI